MAESSGSELTEPFRKKAENLVINGSAGIVAWGVEFARWSQINLAGRAYSGVDTPLPKEPYLSIFQSLGDVGPGFILSAIAYEAIDLLATPAETVTGKRVSEEMKVGAAVFLGIAGVVLHESNLFLGGSWATGSVADAIGGSLGPVAFVGFRMLINKYIESVDQEIESLQVDGNSKDLETSSIINNVK